MGQPPLMLLSLTDEGTAGTHKLASSTFVLYTTCVSHTSSKSCTHVLDQLKKMIRVFFFSYFQFRFQLLLVLVIAIAKRSLERSFGWAPSAPPRVLSLRDKHF